MRAGIFLRVFCLSGLLFGGIQALLAAVRGATPGEVASVGVGAGLFFGLTMGVILTALNRWQVKRSGQDPATVSTAVDVRERITLPVAPDEALALCRSAVTRVPRATVVQVDEASATLEARVGMTWASFGERIECRVTPADGAAEVSIRSRPTLRTTLVDYGKNRENVERIRAFLTGKGSPAPAPHA